MNKILTENIEAVQRHTIERVSRLFANCAIAQTLLASVEFSETIDFNFYGDQPWIVAKDRSDVEKVLTLAPAGKFWAKEASDTHGPSILYKCEVIPGTTIHLFVQGEALPPTCVLVEEDVTIPAQPERVERRRVLKCKPAAAEAVMKLSGADEQPEQVAPPVPAQEDEGLETREEVIARATAGLEPVQGERNAYGMPT